MAPSSLGSERAHQSSVSILLVDDDLKVRQAMSDALSLSGYRSESLSNAFDALRELKEKKYHMLITDIAMPKMNGIELMEVASKIHPDMPIVLITGFGDVEMVKSCLQKGACDFITKPVNIRELPIIVERNLERRRLEARRLMEKGAQILLEAIKALAAAIDTKDPYTSGHSHRVTELSLLLGDSLDLSSEERYTLQLAAEMHDVGKIGTPDWVLNKPSGLTEEEWVYIREHTIKGAEIVGQIEELEEVASLIRHHHERLDGLGYPDGLKGEAISMLARIIAIADAYDIMTTGRPYCPKRPKEEAIAELMAERGTQFDPGLVEVFIQSMIVRDEIDQFKEEDGFPE